MTDTPPNPYLRDAVLTATPEQLQLMLYDGAIRFANQGKEAIAAQKFDVSYEKLTRAQHIMVEMLSGLNYDVNRELCERMASVYNFIYRKLIDANVTRDPQHVDDALKVLHIERETWQLLMERVHSIRNFHDEDALELEAQSGARPPAPSALGAQDITIPTRT